MKGKVILILLLLAAAVSAAVLVLRRDSASSPTARITWDGVLLEEIDLSRVTEPYSFTLEDESGSNTILVEPGRIRITQADCPDQICVNQGWISDGTVPIVCLPHRLMIAIVNGGGDLDAGAG